MKKVNTKKKSSAKMKLIPAAGSLMISAAMLSTSTYAWFTMSREVEVKNIKMTATVPEDIQISLGHLVDFAGYGKGNALVNDASSYTGLSGNQGVLDKGTGTSADDGNVVAPYNTNDAVSALDWASSADVSEYYRLGKIIPASSIDGQDIYFTPDAAGVGKSLKAGARYYQAANITTAFTWKTDSSDATKSTYAASGDEGGDSAKTTLHAITRKDSTGDKWNDGVTAPSTATNPTDNKYKTATEWNITNDDGYFVDIPIFFRSSAQEELTLAVDAYVTTTQAKDDDDLYLAARAVILYNDTAETSGDNENGYTTAPAADDTSNLLRIRQDNYTGTSIVNYMYTTNATGDAVNSTAGAYANAKEYMGTPYLKVAAGANNTYGPMTKAIVRVWLEGEDPNCWNTNAGQDFNISLKFTKDNLSGAIGDTLPTGVTAGDASYPVTAINHTDEVAGAGKYNEGGTGATSLLPGARVMVKSTSTAPGASTATVDLLEFEYNGTEWSLLTDGSFHYYTGLTYTIKDTTTTVTTSDQIATYLKTAVTSQSVADAHKTEANAYIITGVASGD
jgi:hypothetical protein